MVGSKRLAICLQLFSALCASAAHAAGETCIKVEPDLDRLACYDRELGRTPKAETVAVDAGKWSVTNMKSKMTDQTNVFLTVDSEEVVACRLGSGAKVTLYLRCQESTTSLIFSTSCHMASGFSGYGRIEYRLDKDKARTVSGDASTDNSALGLWSGAKAIPVIKQMFGKSEMVARMVPYGENPFTVTFKIAGVEKAIEPLRKECGW